MRSRYYDRYPQHHEPDASHPYDYGYHRRYAPPRRYGPPHPRSAAAPYFARRGRLAFDAGEPEPPRRSRGWRRYLNDFREAGRHVRQSLRSDDREEEGQLGRGRRFARRYKEPLVGAAVFGATIPLALGAIGGGGQQIAEEGPQSQPIGEPVQAGHPTPRGSVEEDVGGRLASLRQSRVREATINGAMMVYDIPRSLAEQIHDIAIDNDIEPELAFGLVKTESAFDNRAVSNVGARGLTQVMPRTARWLQPGTTIEDLYNRAFNLNMGFGYLRDLIDKYDGDVRLALLAYNRGPGTVDRVLDRGGDPDNGYADMVLSGYTDLS